MTRKINGSIATRNVSEMPTVAARLLILRRREWGTGVRRDLQTGD